MSSRSSDSPFQFITVAINIVAVFWRNLASFKHLFRMYVTPCSASVMPESPNLLVSIRRCLDRPAIITFLVGQYYRLSIDHLTTRKLLSLWMCVTTGTIQWTNSEVNYSTLKNCSYVSLHAEMWQFLRMRLRLDSWTFPARCMSRRGQQGWVSRRRGLFRNILLPFSPGSSRTHSACLRRNKSAQIIS